MLAEQKTKRKNTPGNEMLLEHKHSSDKYIDHDLKRMIEIRIP